MAITKEQMYRAAEQFREYKRKPKHCAYEDAKKIIEFMMKGALPSYKTFIFFMVQGHIFGPDTSSRDFVYTYQRFVLGSPYRRDRIEYIYTLLHG